MDELDQRAPSYRFGPDRRLTALISVLALVAAGLAAVTDDVPGRLLFALATLILLAYAVSDLVFYPRLTASAEGVVVRTWGGAVHLRWAEIDAVRADARERLGLRSVTLEIDADERLFVFSRRALGADPEQAAGIVGAFDPRGS
ncbi:MAG TPA: PH domain-containing protein [Jatrophihabitantaceae bacterium]|nr:PH domain-containing protein [Jatrophihabitantaceae bacterium]